MHFGERIVIKVMLAIFTLVYSANSLAQSTAPRELAVEYIKLSRFEDVLNASVDEYKRQLIDPKATPEAKEKFGAFLESSMGWDSIQEPLTDLVLETYTKQELKASIAFMKSPAGASATAKSEAFATRFSALLSQNLKDTIRKYQDQKSANDGEPSTPVEGPPPTTPGN